MPNKIVFSHFKTVLITVLSVFVLCQLPAQTHFSVQQMLRWTDKPQVHTLANGQTRYMPAFESAVYGEQATPTLPYFQYQWPLNGAGRIVAEVTNAVYAPLECPTDRDHAALAQTLNIETFTTQVRNQFYGHIRFVPIRKIGEKLEKLVSFDLNIHFSPDNAVILRGPLGATESVLSTGTIYKMGVRETGLVRLDYNFLKNELKINNIDQIDPRTIKIYGNGGGMLPETTTDARPDDLVENAVFISGEADGKFDANDYILFYAVGADKTLFDVPTRTFSRPKNIYANETFYFIKISNDPGLRMADRASVQATSYTSATYDAYQRFEEDRTNLMASNPCNCAQGAGKGWYGDFFGEAIRERSYTDKFNFSEAVANSTAQLRANFVGSSSNNTVYEISVLGQKFSMGIGASEPNRVDDVYARQSPLDARFTINATATPEVKVGYPSVGGNRGWLDYLEVQFKAQLRLTGNQLAFRDVVSMGQNATTFNISNTNNNTQIWDITNPQKPVNQLFTNNGNSLSFGVSTSDGLREFVAFDKTAIFAKPTAVGKIPNQNLHNVDNIDLLVLYHKDFQAAAEKLANYRRTQSGLSVATADVEQVYNEFSSGALDPTAIRDFARLLHKRNARFKYLLLMGDGSFDYKRLYPLGTLSPSDFIPTYQSDYSFDAVDAFPSDDYFGLLSDGEGRYLAGALDIGVGRIPCKTAAEADAVVEKIMVYENAKTHGDWRNRVAFMADNGDGSLHLDQCDGIASEVFRDYKNLNVEKLYIDAYKVEVSAGGTRAPQLNEAIYENQFKGLLTLCYLGHGGPRGLAQERVLMREDLESWQNLEKLPLIITATCSFSGYDNPKEISAGEAALLNPAGGAVALFSTVRAVYASSNEVLTRAVFNLLFEKNNQEPQRLGDIFFRSKNNARTGVNGQKFTLLGDPSMRLGLPRYGVATQKINGKDIDAARPDTVRALQKVTIQGIITDDNGRVKSDFNGTIYPTVFDKAVAIRTLGQPFDGGSNPRDFTIQRNILFKGAATVRNGVWQFSFTVPRDIDYAFGRGKISYYATNGQTDAAGNEQNMVIGGTNDSLTADNQAPLVQVFMNDEQFVSGGITDPNPTLFVKLRDDNGINITGTSIGHDLTAKLNDSNTPIVLNNFYEAAKDDATQGQVRYPLSKLAPGRYRVAVKAWDVANNPAEAQTEFIVAENGGAALAHVLNYPNPFSTQTRFQLEHNLAGQDIHVRVNIYTVSGRIVKTIDYYTNADSYRITDIEWDGKDEYGNELARGVYVYKISVTGKNVRGQKTAAESGFEKLVIIK